MRSGVAEISVSAPRGDGDASRISAVVGGEELWFEAEDCALSASAEAFATALLPIAAAARARLLIPVALDPVWVRNAARILPIWNDWWGYEPRLERVVEAPQRELGTGPLSTDVGLCFTLGVDSFHTLLRSDYTVDRLLFAVGYDVPLGDDVRVDAIRRSLAAVCERTGCRSTVIRTNLREHPVGVHMDWERGHGGPIVALGHLAEAQIGELLLSASFPYYDSWPWGSHYRTDSGWSSSRVRVTHVGAEKRRAMKLAELVDEELVQGHLRVCWENRARTGNCGECEKCVRTMLGLEAHDALARFPVFPGDGLADRVDSLPELDPLMIEVYGTLRDQVQDRQLRRAITRLIERSET